MPGVVATRGALLDKIVEQAENNPRYAELLMKDPRALMEKQLGMTIPSSVNIKVLEETADTYYVVIPYKAKEGAELSDADLEKVAGGATVKGDANCSGSLQMACTVVEVGL